MVLSDHGARKGEGRPGGCLWSLGAKGELAAGGARACARWKWVHCLSLNRLVSGGFF